MTAIDSQNMQNDDASGTLTIKTLKVLTQVDTRTATRAGAVTQTKSSNYTMAEGDSGKTTYVDTDAVVITLPATVVGMTFTFVNAGADGTVGFFIARRRSWRLSAHGACVLAPVFVTTAPAPSLTIL